MSEEYLQRIERKALLHVPRQRVWKALTNADEFGSWFRANLDNSFVVGERVLGTSTYPGHEHMKFEMTIARMEAEHHFSFLWHPYPIDLKIGESTTLVEFDLEDVLDGTRLIVSESGFEQFPASRREEAFRMNSDGWTEQMKNIQRHVQSDTDSAPKITDLD